MKDKMKGGFAVGKTMTSLMLAVLFLFASWSSATIWTVPDDGLTIQDILDNPSFAADDTILVKSGTYAQDLLVNISPVTIRGINNPVLTNGSPGGNVITIDVPDVTITGFTIKGNPKGASAAGILVNDSPEIGKPLVVYNNIIENGIGFQNDYSGSDWEADPILNFWGQYGNGANRGRPGAESGLTLVNNDVSPSVLYNPWLTAVVVNGEVTDALEQYPDCDGIDQLILNNEEAGINIELSDGSLKYDPQLGVTSMGSALYNSSPYIPINSPVPGTAIKFFNVFIKHYEGPVGKASVDISYDLADVDGIVMADTLKPYVLVGSEWRAANDVVVDELSQTVHGIFPTFPDHWADGSIIALVGQTYKVTIVPHPDSSTPIQDKPVFTTFKIESMNYIDEVSYQIDSHSGVWKPIEDGTGLGTAIWEDPGWNITDEEWADLTNAIHTFYFKFTDGSEIGANGEISWQFVKGGEIPPEDLVKIISPKPGQKLSRTPVQIKWTLPSEENIDSIDIWFDRYGDFNKNGGLNNPLHLATLGGGTTFSWRSPNIQTDTAKILVVVTYMDGAEYYGISENFSIVKGYSFKAYKKAPKPVYNVGSGISQGVATIGAWFHKPRLPFLV